jgi:hypothetical protein
MPASPPARPSDRAAGATLAPLVVLVERDPGDRAQVRGLLDEWGLRVSEPDLGIAVPVQDEHRLAAGIIATYGLGVPADGTSFLTGLDLALLITRRAGRSIPTLILSGDYGRDAIRACSPHRIPVFFKPVVPTHLWAWLRSASLVQEAAASASTPKRGLRDRLV